MSIVLEKRERVRSDVADLRQKICITDFPETLDLLLPAETGEIVLLLRLNASNIVTDLFG